MPRRLAGFIIDCQGADLASATAFWSQALGLPIRDPNQDGKGRYAVLGGGAGGWHVEVQVVDHPSRLHLDIDSDNVPEDVTRLEALGATRVGSPNAVWCVMQAPSGQRFCVVPRRDREPVAPPVVQSSARHHSNLVALVIDCHVGQLDSATDFWAAALERDIASRDQDGDGKYAELATTQDEPYLLLQRVDHDPRVHLDIQADDIEAEAARLESLGATRVQFLKRWWVMQAPTGHRFCIVRQQPNKAGVAANAWA